jgi:multidrug efflux pump subunit AcrB
MKRPEIMYAFTTFNTGNRNTKLNIDEDRAKQLGVSINEICKPCKYIMAVTRQAILTALVSNTK